MSVERLRLWSGLIILGVYLAGAATAGGVFVLMAPRHEATAGAPRGPWPILQQLDLSEDQQRDAMRIMTSNRAVVEATIRDAGPRIHAARERTIGELRAILTPEQAARFDALRAEQLKRR